jgi:Ricin-type beta-trefoil lectin domain-like
VIVASAGGAGQSTRRVSRRRRPRSSGCSPTRPSQSQQWKFVYRSYANGLSFYEVVARHSGKCLDKSGWNVIQWNCHGGDWQQWSRPF